MEYNSITETAVKWGISTRRIRVLCTADRIPGAQRVGACWVIPADAVKPMDRRIKLAGNCVEASSRVGCKQKQ